MRIIGLTGGTGSGKGEVSNILKKNGVKIINADEIGHKVILKGQRAYEELVNYFGNEILNENGEIVRQKLGAIVFSNKNEKLEFLNKCTHKHIYEEISQEIETFKKQGAKIIVIDAPLLLEGNFKELCSEIWVVFASENSRLERIIKRDGINKEHGENRINSQKPWEHYESHAQVVIDNSKDLLHLEMEVYKYL